MRYDARVRLGKDRYIVVDFAIAPMFGPDGQVTYLDRKSVV